MRAAPPGRTLRGVDTDTLVIGAGQAGIAASAHLRRKGVPHLVLERSRIAERWRSERWDSLVANGPAWHDRFPDMEISGVGANDFAPAAAMVRYFEDYAAAHAGEIREGVEVTRLAPEGGGFRAETSRGAIRSARAVVATGPFQRPVIPPVIPEGALHQIHSAAYRSPGALPPGGVVVVGAGSSGSQIAEELARSGRRTWLCVGAHNRPPRAYRGLDFCWWLGVLGKWEDTRAAPGREHVTIAVSGAYGGRTVDFRRLAADGVTLAGSAERFDDGRLLFAPDLSENIALGDADHAAVLDEADRYAEAHGLDLPPDPGARERPPDPPCVTDPVRALDLAAEGVSTVVWATGYAPDYGWLEAGRLDPRGMPVHDRGASPCPGLYFVGLPWQQRRGSAFVWGVWHDAAYVAERIWVARGYDSHLAKALQ